jgi:multiple sugar transport system ATP-binding protein
MIMGLRTEDLFIAHEDERDDNPPRFTVDGTIEIIEPLGNETNLHMDFKGVKLVAKAEGRRVSSVGDQLKITLDLSHLHIFDAESEQSIY